MARWDWRAFLSLREAWCLPASAQALVKNQRGRILGVHPGGSKPEALRPSLALAEPVLAGSGPRVTRPWGPRLSLGRSPRRIRMKGRSVSWGWVGAQDVRKRAKLPPQEARGLSETSLVAVSILGQICFPPGDKARAGWVLSVF